ncbi:MAG: chemoreceptor glutamine deamidase CheD [Xanthobacteraceae bacterium]
MTGAAQLSHSVDDGAVNDGVIHAASGRRFYDSANSSWVVKVFPGEYFITSKSDEVLVTVLGSCVSACIRDPIVGIGGMNHFMLAEGERGGWGGALDSESTRYGNFAMEKLINELLKAGCSRKSMEIKVFGGGNVTDTSNAIGSQNAEFVLRYLKAEGLQCAAQDLGGQHPRRIHYFPATGRVIRRLLGGGETYSITRQESEYAKILSSKKTAGEIELFG